VLEYSIDTSALVQGWKKLYPIDILPGLWDNIGGLIDGGILGATQLVERELGRGADDLATWAKMKTGLFVPVDDKIQEVVKKMMQDHPNLANAVAVRNDADPFVIALAQIQSCTVICEENKRNDRNSTKMPDLCDYFGIRCISLLELIRERGWVFR